MASIELNARIDDRELALALERLNMAATDLSPAMRDLGEHVLRTTEDRFRSETGPDGKPWQRLSRRYARRKRGSKILTESRRLRRSITYKADADGLKWGTNVKYAAIHQLGGEIKRKARSQVVAFSKKGRFLSRRAASKQKRGAVSVKFTKTKAGVTTMPARPYLGISDEDKKAAIRIMHRHLERALWGK